MSRERKAGAGAALRRVQTGAVFAAFIAAIAVFVFMLNMERSILAGFEKRLVYVVTEDIAQGQRISQDMAMTLFQQVEVDAGCIPEDVLEHPEEIVNRVSLLPLRKGTVLSQGMFWDIEEALTNMYQPVVVGVKAEDLYQVAGGIIRSGDRIHIYVEDEETGEILLRWEDLMVAQSFDASGNEIQLTDHVSASRLNLYLEKADVEEFYRGLTANKLRAVKVCK